MLPVSFQPFFVLAIIGLTFISIYLNWLRPAVSFLLAVVIFLIAGILTPQEVLSGFGNDKIASILLLILITAGIRKNFNLERLFDYIFGKTQSYSVFLFRMMSQVAIFSSMINNTPVVALMTPYVMNWGKSQGIAPSKLLIPLSFATIMGGMLTVIGTSTNLLLNGFLDSYDQDLMKSMDLLLVGGAVTVTGILFLTLYGHRLLPNREDVIDHFNRNKSEYVVETVVSSNSSVIGKDIAEAGLRNLTGLYLVEVVRNQEIHYPVDPALKLQAGDVLLFAGQTDKIIDLIKSNKGINLPPQEDLDVAMGDKIEVVECVVASNWTLVERTVKDYRFRERYNAAVIAVQRAGEKLSGKIGDIKLKPGDLILILPGRSFFEKADLNTDLYVVSSLRDQIPSSRRNVLALVTVALAVITLVTFQQTTLFSTLIVIFSIMVGFRLITNSEIKRELDLNLIGILVFSLSIGLAIIKTDAASIIADGIISTLQPHGTVAIIIGLMLLANVLTSLIGNVGAISITFPLAFTLTESLGVDSAPYYLAIAYAASATFITPISYQTNLIIFGPGGYRFSDFLKVGLPVTMLYLTVALTVIWLIYGHTF